MSSNKQKQMIFVVQNDALVRGDVDSFQCVALPHPKYDVPTRYLVVADVLHEVQCVYQTPSSWFIDQGINADGSLYVATPIDPLYLLIPFLYKARGKTTATASSSSTSSSTSSSSSKASSDAATNAGYFCALSEVVSRERARGCRRIDVLLAAVTSPSPSSSSFDDADADATAAAAKHKQQQLEHICDVKEGWDDQVYRLNDDKVVAWLQCKMRALCEMLALRASVVPAGVSAADAVSNPAIVKVALGIVSEYVSDQILTLLLARAYPSVSREDIYPTGAAGLHKSGGWGNDVLSGDVDTTRVTAADVEAAENGGGSSHSSALGKRKVDASSSTSKAKAAAAKKLQKINTSGMKSLASFFGGGKAKAKK